MQLYLLLGGVVLLASTAICEGEETDNDFDPDSIVFEDTNLEKARRVLKNGGDLSSHSWKSLGKPTINEDVLRDLKQRDRNLYDYLVSFMTKPKHERPPPDYYFFLGNQPGVETTESPETTQSPNSEADSEDASPISSEFWRMAGNLVKTPHPSRRKRLAQNQPLSKASDYWKQPGPNRPKELVNYLTSFIDKPANEKPPPDYYFYLGSQLGKSESEEGTKAPQETAQLPLETTKSPQMVTESLGSGSENTMVSTESSIGSSPSSTETLENVSVNSPDATNSSVDIGITLNQTENPTDILQNSSDSTGSSTGLSEIATEMNDISQDIKPITEEQDEPTPAFGPEFWRNFNRSSNKSSQTVKSKRHVHQPLLEHPIHWKEQFPIHPSNGYGKYQRNTYNAFQFMPFTPAYHYQHQHRPPCNHRNLNSNPPPTQFFHSTTQWPIHAQFNPQHSAPHYDGFWNTRVQGQYHQNSFNMVPLQNQNPNGPNNPSFFIPNNQVPPATQWFTAYNPGAFSNRPQDFFVSGNQNPSLIQNEIFMPAQIPQNTQNDYLYGPSQRIPTSQGSFGPAQTPPAPQNGIFSQIPQEESPFESAQKPQIPQDNSFELTEKPSTLQEDTFVAPVQKPSEPQVDDLLFPSTETPMFPQYHTLDPANIDSQNEDSATITYPKETTEDPHEIMTDTPQAITGSPLPLVNTPKGTPDPLTMLPVSEKEEVSTFSPKFWKASPDFIKLQSSTTRTRRYAEFLSEESKDQRGKQILGQQKGFDRKTHRIPKQGFPQRNTKFPVRNNDFPHIYENLKRQKPVLLGQQNQRHLHNPFISHPPTRHNPQLYELSKRNQKRPSSLPDAQRTLEISKYENKNKVQRNRPDQSISTNENQRPQGPQFQGSPNIFSRPSTGEAQNSNNFQTNAGRSPSQNVAPSIGDQRVTEEDSSMEIVMPDAFRGRMRRSVRRSEFSLEHPDEMSKKIAQEP